MLRKGCFIRACYSIINWELNKQIRRVNQPHWSINMFFVSLNSDTRLNMIVQINLGKHEPSINDIGIVSGSNYIIKLRKTSLTYLPSNLPCNEDEGTSKCGAGAVSTCSHLGGNYNHLFSSSSLSCKHRTAVKASAEMLYCTLQKLSTDDSLTN
jgi:hypothetical protein